MIYSISIRNEYNEDKQFFISAEDISKMYKRVLSTYGTTKDKIEILEEYEETPDWGVKLVKSNVSHLSSVDKDNIKKAKEIFFNSSRKCEPYKSDAFKKYKYKDIIYIDSEKDVVPLVKKYNKVKVYWELTDTRGVHQYYAFVK